MAILEVNNLKKCYRFRRGPEGHRLLPGAGQAISVIGSSGSGKTTLLRCLNFLESPDAGQILVRGRVIFSAADPSTQKEREIRRKRLHFGLVFQNFNLFPQ